MKILNMHLGRVDFDAVRLANKLSIGGQIYFSVDSSFFPEENWYDIVDVLLDAWLPRLLSFAYNHTDHCVLQFMDGPYSIRLNRNTDATISACFLRDSIALYQEPEIDFSDFLSSVAACAREFSRLLYLEGHQAFSSEIEQFGKFSKDFRQLAKS